MPKADSDHALLAVITVDSAFKKDKNYYSQMQIHGKMQTQCKFIQKEKKWLDMTKKDDLEIYSDD